jgi:hypothetical protein
VEGAAVVKISRERAILGDINNWMEEDEWRGKLRHDYDENT